MDLMDFEGAMLWYEQPLSSTVEVLLQQAGERYGQEEAEWMLLAAYMLQPEHLAVHVAMYRYYFYRHRLHEAMLIAERTLQASAALLGYTGNWRDADLTGLRACSDTMVLVRYYLMALKASGLIALRLGDDDDGMLRLQKVQSMDGENRLGIRELIGVVNQYRMADHAA